MKNLLLGTLPAALAIGAVLAGSAQAAEIFVNSNISTSDTWTANNTYNLTGQIYVLPGATLTIEAGTVVASTTNAGGSLAVCRGAKIFVLGTQDKPVIMTSKADQATWTGGNPKTGTWREGANEWGNLTVMGAAFISENAVVGNVPSASPSNVANMEGLVAGPSTDQYGGGNDDDDSGTIRYVSLRYGGKVVGLNNELNGLSLGGIGRESVIHHVDVMNNVDDGIEIWGGTVNLSYLNVWNVGDDSIDIDQGYRGKMQFGLIVQGWSANASQGSGVGDNMFETDGAEDSDWQPVTTATIYNFTAIGQPVDGDQATAWRDNARVQYRNCVFMDTGENVVHLDNVDGDGAHGYGFGGTLTWAQTWTTGFAFSNGALYQAQSSGNLAEIKDSVFFRNLFGTAYNEANNVNVFAGGNNNVLTPGFADVDSPVSSLLRAGPVVKGGKTMLQVTSLDPRPANAALTSVASAPVDGFFKAANYRGGFAPGETWLNGWTASTAYGFTTTTSPFVGVAGALEGLNGEPRLEGHGTLVAGSSGSIELTNAKGSAAVALFVGLAQAAAPFKGGVLVPVPWLLQLPLGTPPNGALTLPWASWPSGLSGVPLYFQYAIQDATGPKGFSLSNALKATSP